MEKKGKVPGCKVVLLGDSGVGKTCIISRYISGEFKTNIASTNGASYASKNVKFETVGKNLLLDIWDTAGQEKYKSLTKYFYKDASIIILVYHTIFDRNMILNKEKSLEVFLKGFSNWNAEGGT